MKSPNDTSLPFFAYGIFKPGQLCYSRIQDLVTYTIACSVSGMLKERDGVPLLVLGNNYLQIKGYLIFFHEGKGDEAYERIISIEPDEVYRWKCIRVNNSDVNVLLGRKESRGSSDIEYIDEWDGKSDPLFTYGLDEVERILNENTNFDNEYKALLRLQMAYMLLWSAIERYAGLKYHLGRNVTQKVLQIATDNYFIDCLSRYVTVKREVFSTTDLKKYILDPKDPKKSIEYYYQVRSNAVHRGKVVHKDFETIKDSLSELLKIFKCVLNNSFSNSN